jgi:hypothetical protein
MKKILKRDYLELIIFLSHYHSGQGSRGYRLMSKLISKYRPNWTSNFEKEATNSDIYYHLQVNYKGMV